MLVRELVDILLLSLSAQEFAGGHVEKGGSRTEVQLMWIAARGNWYMFA